MLLTSPENSYATMSYPICRSLGIKALLALLFAIAPCGACALREVPAQVPDGSHDYAQRHYDLGTNDLHFKKSEDTCTPPPSSVAGKYDSGDDSGFDVILGCYGYYDTNPGWLHFSIIPTSSSTLYEVTGWFDVQTGTSSWMGCEFSGTLKCTSFLAECNPGEDKQGTISAVLVTSPALAFQNGSLALTDGCTMTASWSTSK
jgi:hypothetical protein